jgi:hypothetical protein
MYACSAARAVFAVIASPVLASAAENLLDNSLFCWRVARVIARNDRIKIWGTLTMCWNCLEDCQEIGVLNGGRIRWPEEYFPN